MALADPAYDARWNIGVGIFKHEGSRAFLPNTTTTSDK